MSLHDTNGTAESSARSRMLLTAILSFRDGDFSKRLPSDWDGIEGQIAAAFNQTISHEDQISAEVARLRDVAGQQPVTTPAGVASLGQKAIERQRALVAPDLAAPVSRGPLS